MGDRDQILANFQQITAIDDIELAISALESTDWNLEAAISNVIEEDQSHSNSNYNDMNLGNPSFIDTPGPSSSRDSPEDLFFNVFFSNNVHRIPIQSSKTVKDLKQEIATRTEIPICRQQIKGWSKFVVNPSDSSPLRNLNVSKENNIFLTDLSTEGLLDEDVMIVDPSPPPSMFQLRIHLVADGKDFDLNFPPTKTILDIKNDMHAITRIPVRHQKWIGWPENLSNSTKLSDTGIGAVHNLTLSRFDTENNFNRDTPVEIDSDSDVEEYEDAMNADDDIFAEPVQQNRLKTLIEDQTEEEILGCLQFVSNYRDRYGSGPNFFEGTLDDAVKTACCAKSAKDRKLLAIYLHHDRSVLSNVFCVQLLNNENIVKQLSENYVLWGWDVTCESNKNMFLSSLTACVGDSASLQIRNTNVNQFPIIMLIRKYRSNGIEIADLIHGNINNDELFIHLITNHDTFSEQMRIEIREEYERLQRESLLKEQQQAYQESLEADRAKEEAKLHKEKMMATERRRQESERAEIEARKEAIRKEAENSLPPEPVGTDHVTKIRFRKPTGDFMERRFTVETKLQVLLNFATANGFSTEDFKIISSYPRRDLTTLDPDETFKSLKLYPQETVILEER